MYKIFKKLSPVGIIPFGIIATMLGLSFLQAQINTESMRKKTLEKGLHVDVGSNVGLMEGNSSVFQNRTVLRVDYVRDRDHAFLVSNYRMGKKDKSLFVNKGFSHLRYMYPFTKNVTMEGFLQQEFNEFIQLNQRSLVGAGIRIKWDTGEKSKIHIPNLTTVTGFGFMWERELIDTGPAGDQGDPVHGDLASLLRSTNYLVLKWELKPEIIVQNTTYYQVDTRRISDYRILTRATFSIVITRRLSMTLDCNFRYDSEPPGMVKALDMDINNGFHYKIK